MSTGVKSVWKDRAANYWKHEGDYAEIIACSWLLKEGYEVFRNISSKGPIDIIGWKNGETFLFDVKSAHNNSPVRKNTLTEEQVKMDVKVLVVNKDNTCKIYTKKELPTRPLPKIYTKNCENCKKIFETRNTRQKFCEMACKCLFYKGKDVAKGKHVVPPSQQAYWENRSAKAERTADPHHSQRSPQTLGPRAA
jgi:Holliday junction resolvase-like predicted endonuclease